MNGYFKLGDEYADEIEDCPIPNEWWSRHYEYPWALQYAQGIVADMGAGWMGRPFKDMLAKRAETVYAFDLDKRLLDLPVAHNVKLIAQDFTHNMTRYHSLFDRIFCISVLEDVPDICQALTSFRKCLAPDGKIVLTMDCQYDIGRPLGKYPAVDMEKFIFAIPHAGLQFAEDTDFDKWNVVYHSDYNLCVFHCVLEAVDEKDDYMQTIGF